MDFILNEEQDEYQKLAREVAQKQLAPKAHELDLSGQAPEEVWRGIWQSGLFNVQMPDSLGGLALGCLDAAVIAEELAAGCSGISAAVEGNALAILPLLHAGDNNQKQRLLKPLTDDLVLAGYAVDIYGEQPAHKIEAKRNGDGFELSGDLPMVTNGGAGAWFVVLADLGATGTLFVVDRQTAGVTVLDKPYLLGRRAADWRRVRLERVKMAAGNMVGTEGGAAAILDAVRPSAHVLLSAACIGIARSGLEHAVRYAKERHTFGQPIANHQGVQFMLADMAKDIEAARLLAWQAATLIDKGSPDAYCAAVSRSFSQNMAMRAATDAVQVFGGYGYSKEYPVEKLMRDSKMYQLFDGTAAQLHVNIGRELLGAGST